MTLSFRDAAADVAGYSRLMERDEVGTLRVLIDCREVIDRLISEHRGRIANTAGDSVPGRVLQRRHPAAQRLRIAFAKPDQGSRPPPAVGKAISTWAAHHGRHGRRGSDLNCPE